MAGVRDVMSVLFVTLVYWSPWNPSTLFSIWPARPMRRIQGQSAAWGRIRCRSLLLRQYWTARRQIPMKKKRTTATVTGVQKARSPFRRTGWNPQMQPARTSSE